MAGCETVKERLAAYLLTPHQDGAALPPDLLTHLAGCPRCLADLEQLGTNLGIESTAFGAQVAALRQCAECEESLGAYVDRELAQQDAAMLYPDTAQHLQHCERCQAHYEALHQMLHQDAEEPWVPAPKGSNFAAWFRLQQKTSLWEAASGTVRHLAIAIPVFVGKARAAFGPLPPSLTLRAVPVEQLMSAPPTSSTSVMELEIPDHEADIAVRVRMCLLAHGVRALIVYLSTASSSVPLAGAYVVLYDGDGVIVEAHSTEPDGSVTFADLRNGKYTVEIEHQGRKWDFAITLTEDTNAEV